MIPDERIFDHLPADRLPAIARYLRFDPPVYGTPLSQLPENAKIAWLDAHRRDLEEEFRWAGSSIFGPRKTYREIVMDAAERAGAVFSPASRTRDIERALIQKLWKNALTRMSGQQRAELEAALREVAGQHGKEFGGELAALAALSAAQLSGFGVYVLGSTLLGALNSALGLGLGFGAFTGLSSLISVIIGPVGWAALGLLTILKLGAPNYEKVLPVIVEIAVWRAQTEAAASAPKTAPDNAAAKTTPAARVWYPPAQTPTPQADAAAAPVQSLPVQTPPPAQRLEAAIATAAERAGRRKKRSAAETRRPPGARDKIIFNLQHPELCELAQRLAGVHFLDLPEEDQAVVRELHRELQEQRRQQEKQERKRMRELRRAEKRAARCASNQEPPGEGDVSNALRLLSNLALTDEALRRLEELSPHQREIVLEKLRQLNAGNIRSKHVVPLTSPRVFQRDAGKDLKIYYRRDGGPNRILVCLIGTKSTQEADYEAMRRAG